jgi:hypothetical protein
MRLKVSPPCKAISRITRFRGIDYLLTVVTCCRFVLVPGAACEPLPGKDQPGPRMPAAYDDGLGSSRRYDGDLAPYKPRGDVLLTGSCHAPGGQAATGMRAAFGVGDWRKAIDVTGDREWLRDANGEVVTSPIKPFTTMPLRQEMAFGGLGSRYNPWGKGFGKLAEQAGARLAIANLHPAGEQHARWDLEVIPAGFGPIAPSCEPRRSLRGTRDQAWHYRRRPLPPEDFDWGFYNAAPPDQQIEGYLRGDEALYLENLHPELAKLESRLPGVRVRTFLNRRDPGAPADEDRQEEVRTVLDTLHVDTDAMTVDLVWRACAAVQSPKAADAHGLVVWEPLQQEPRPAEHYAAQLREQVAPPRPAASPATGGAAEPQGTSPEAAREQAKAAVEHLRGLKLPLEPALLQRLEGAATPDELQAMLVAELRRLQAQAPAAGSA